MKGQRLTVVLSQDEGVHAPQSKHVQEVPGRRAHPAGSTQTRRVNKQDGRHREAEGSYQEASRDSRSMPLCSMGLNRSVRGKGTLAEQKKQTR